MLKLNIFIIFGYLFYCTSAHTVVTNPFLDDNDEELKECKKKLNFNHSCVLTPFSTEGPYFIHEDILFRKDIRENKQGIPLNLTLKVFDVSNCEPVPSLQVYIWQCDSLGKYSGYSKDDEVDSKPSLKFITRVPPTDDRRYLRGIQTTDEEGMVNFQTIVPGWYAVRSVHIHIEILSSNITIYTGQLYFNDDFASTLVNILPYKKSRFSLIKNDDDFLFNRYSGNKTVLHLSGNEVDGYNSEFSFFLKKTNSKNTRTSASTFSSTCKKKKTSLKYIL